MTAPRVRRIRRRPCNCKRNRLPCTRLRLPQMRLTIEKEPRG